MIRLFVFGFLFLSVIYLCLAFYSQSVRRSKLERWWEESDKSKDLDTYVKEGLRDYHEGFRSKLLFLVYVVPMVVVGVIIYVVNFM